MLKNLKRKILNAAAQRRADKLAENCGELLEHFDWMLAEFRKQSGGKPEHKPMENNLSRMAENLRITHVFLIESAKSRGVQNDL